MEILDSFTRKWIQTANKKKGKAITVTGREVP
jgi:hypothetical protein